MNFHRNRKEKLEITLTPMIDVVFLLLIFFMVTTTFNRETELNIKLPEAEGAESKDYPKAITLIIDAEGTYYIAGEDGKAFQLVNQKLSTLRKALVQAAGNSRKMPVIISADSKTPHQAVISALDIAGQAGFAHITFATKNIAGKENE